MRERIQTVAVAGAGTMGPGMAATFARHGFDTYLVDISGEALARARLTVDAVYGGLMDGGLLTPEAASAGRSRVQYSTDVAEVLRLADFVVEAIPEQLDAKRQFFREAEAQVGEDVILASNTSGIPITDLGRSTRRPERVVGMHWSNPPHLIPVVEVVRGAHTGDETVQITRRLVERIAMIPILVRRDVPGFVENRILYAIMREALHLLEEGVATAEDLDTVVRWGIGYKLAVIGPLELLDVAGLDIYHAVASYLNQHLSARPDVSPLVARKVEGGELGIKAGRGLFQYTPEGAMILAKRRASMLLRVDQEVGRSVAS